MNYVCSLVFFLIVFSTSSLACKCAPPENHDEFIISSFNHYSQVFIGEVIMINNETWIKVIEVFKGTLSNDSMVQAGFEEHSCAYFFGKQGKILFYGSLTKSKLVTDLCSPTRSFEEPRLYSPPPPPEPNSEPDSNRRIEIYNQRYSEYKKLEKERLKYEIEKLRLLGH